MKKVIIIGGGIAGLSAGIYAIDAGFEAEIYEKNSLPGGQCMGWTRDGLHIDNCIHWLTGTKKGTALYDVWNKLGAIDDNTVYADKKSFFSVTKEGKTGTLWYDLEKTQKELCELCPEDKEEIEKFIEFTRYAQDCLIPAEKPMEMMSIMDYIRMGKDMANMGKVMKEFGKISLEDYAKRFKSSLMKEIIMGYMHKDYTAYSFLVSYGTMSSGNGKLPQGGSLAMSLRIRDKFLSMGGKLITGKGVKSIDITKKTATGITLEDGTKVTGDYVIPAVDTHILFEKLPDKKYMPKILKKAYENEAHYPVMSGLQAAYALEGESSIKHNRLFECRPFRAGRNEEDMLMIQVYDYEPIYVRDGRCVIQSHIMQGHEDYKWWKSLTKEEYDKAKAQAAASGKFAIQRILKAER